MNFTWLFWNKTTQIHYTLKRSFKVKLGRFIISVVFETPCMPRVPSRVRLFHNIYMLNNNKPIRYHVQGNDHKLSQKLLDQTPNTSVSVLILMHFLCWFPVMAVEARKFWGDESKKIEVEGVTASKTFFFLGGGESLTENTENFRAPASAGGGDFKRRDKQKCLRVNTFSTL